MNIHCSSVQFRKGSKGSRVSDEFMYLHASIYYSSGVIHLQIPFSLQVQVTNYTHRQGDAVGGPGDREMSLKHTLQ